jgi:hypothetical protein
MSQSMGKNWIRKQDQQAFVYYNLIQSLILAIYS